MDAIGLALKMQRLTIWLEENCQPETLIRLQSGDGYLIIDPARQGDVASYNYNRVLLCGREAAMDALSVAIRAASKVRLRILIDRSSIEVFANDGLVTMTSCFIPSRDAKAPPLSLTGDGARVTSLDVWELKSCWGR